MKVPSKEDMKRIKMQNAKILEVLKEGAREELESRKYISSGRKKLLGFLLQNNELTGIPEWGPSEKTLQQLRKLPFMEDRLIEEDMELFKKWLLKEVEWKIKIGDIPSFTNIIEMLEPSIRGKDNLFLRRGNIWIVKFTGKWTAFKDNEMLRYIIHLLDNPNKQIHILDLKNAVKGDNSDNLGNAYNSTAKEYVSLEEIDASSYDIDLSEDDFDKFEEIINNTASKLKAADAGSDEMKKSDTREEWENLKKHLLNNYGLEVGLSKDNKPNIKKHRRLKPEVEKVRQNIKNQINKGYRYIAKSFPALSSYLKDHISRGVHCVYTPDNNDPIKWDIFW